jgi:hypothetical protein
LVFPQLAGAGSCDLLEDFASYSPGLYFELLAKGSEVTPVEGPIDDWEFSGRRSVERVCMGNWL